jgi:hypothetical protein
MNAKSKNLPSLRGTKQSLRAGIATLREREARS